MSNQQTDSSRERNAEIAQLNHELEILQDCRATEERSRRRLTVFFMCLPVICIGIVLIIIFQDPMAGLVAGGLMLLMGASALFPYALGPKGRRIVAPLFGYFDFGFRGVTTDEQIAERERRLIDLGVREPSKPSVPVTGRKPT